MLDRFQNATAATLPLAPFGEGVCLEPCAVMPSPMWRFHLKRILAYLLRLSRASCGWRALGRCGRAHCFHATLPITAPFVRETYDACSIGAPANQTHIHPSTFRNDLGEKHAN